MSDNIAYCKHGQLARVCYICEVEAEIATLRAENTALSLERDIRRMAETRNAELLVENGALKKDAERYRHMRNNSTFRDKNGPGLYWYLPRFLPGDKGEKLDAAIDAELEKGKS